MSREFCSWRSFPQRGLVLNDDRPHSPEFLAERVPYCRYRACIIQPGYCDGCRHRTTKLVV
jgi:hypothetical protein